MFANFRKSQTLNYDPDKEIYIAIIAGTILFLLFAGFIVTYLVIYWKRKVQHRQEVEKMQMVFTSEVLKSQLEMQEQTLTHISQEIHDNVGQVLSLVKVQVNILAEKNTLDKNTIYSIKENLGKALTDLRNMTRSMNTQRVLSWSFTEELTHEINRVHSTGLLAINFACEGEERPLEQHNKLVLFRIFQECLQNIIRHAEASASYINLVYDSSQLLLTVQDNGKGFIPASVTGKGLGLQSIRSRAQLIGGTAVIDSTPGKGTLITITIPCI